MTDTTAPVLTSLIFPTTINLSSGNQPLTFSVHAEDVGLGIGNVTVMFDKPFSSIYGTSNRWDVYVEDGWNDSTPFDASAQWRLLSANNSGVYHITSVVVTDVAGNKRTYSSDQMAALGISNSFTIKGKVADTTAPTATFNPADEAGNVGVASDILVTFNEAIMRGTGNIVLKTFTGSTVATYNAATSGNLSISGSTLTLDPSADLLPGTAYKVEFASGSIKDLAGNKYAGTTSYNFTTASGPSKFDDLIVLQNASSTYVGGDAGNDTYLLSGSMLAPGLNLTISDSKGNNSLQLMGGLAIASSKVANNALQLTLNNGSVVNVFGASTFSYETGGNMTTGVDLADLSYASFAENALGVAVPASGVASGAALIVGNQSPVTALPAQSRLDDFIVLQKSSSTYVGAGVGNDTYLLSSSMLSAGLNLTISDSQGANSLQLANGLDIASSKVASNALQLTLTNGSVINVFGANAFTFDIGGNKTVGIDNIEINYASFVQTVLGITLPTSGVVSGGPALIGVVTAPPPLLTTPLVPGTTAAVLASAQADIFTFTPAAARALTANTQINLSQFDTVNDKLQFDLTTALGTTTLAALNGVEGISVQANDITNETLISFGADANGDVVSLILLGVVTPASVVANII